MKLDTGVLSPDLEAAGEAAKRAEDLGLAGVWTAETSHDPFLPLLLAAQRTERVDLGTAIAVAFPRSPMVLAQIAWDLQRYSKGRFILGLGTQVRAHNERRFGVKWESPGPRLREMIQMIHAIWDTWQEGARPDFRGDFYQFTLMTPFFNPGPIPYPRPRIFIAGVNEYMCRLGGEMCDGFHIHPFHSVRYLDQIFLPNLQRGLEKGNRPRSAVELSTTAFVVTGRNEAEIEAAKAPVRQQIAFYASTPTYASVLEIHGWGEVGQRLTALSKQGKWMEMADEITDEMLEVYAVTARHDDLVDVLRRKYDGYLNRLAFYFPFTALEPDLLREMARAFAAPA